MKTIAIGSIFVLFALAAGVSAPAAFADHSEVTITPVDGSGVPGCEETPEGCYNPTIATVDVGGTVIVSNTDSVAHTVTSGTGLGEEDGFFDSSFMLPGSSFEWVPEEIGEYPHFCQVHPWMTGTIIVQEAGAETGMEDGHEDHGHDDDNGEMMGMMMMEDASGTGMLSDGTMVMIKSAEPMIGEQIEISIMFEDSEHVNYDLMVMQDGETVLDDIGAHEHEGMGTHMTAPLVSDNPVDVMVTFQGYGIDEKTGPIGEEVAFTEVVPEFGTIAMMILAVAAISVVAVTAKSRVVPRF